MIQHFLSTYPFPSHEWAVFFDIDGTLAEIAQTPSEVRIPHSVMSDLHCLKRHLNGAVGIVSGRSLQSIDALFAPSVFSAAGQHGLELRTEGEAVFMFSKGAEIVKMLSRHIANFHHNYPSLYVEYKGLSVAVHYRISPMLAGMVKQYLDTLVAPWRDLIAIQHGKMVSEIKLNHADKGVAIYRLMEKEPFRGRLPVFIGDDITDERGFAVINGLQGISIKVGNGPTIAHHRLPDVESVHAWLKDILLHLQPTLGSSIHEQTHHCL